MMQHNPEVQQWFVPSHQRTGQQPAALAGAILAYVQHLEAPLPALAGAVETIAQKHCSLLIPAEGYGIVGTHLLESLKEVANAPTDLVDAYAEAYGVLADVFIQREKAIYAQQKHAPGGWSGKRRFVVARKEKESDDMMSLYLRPVDGKKVIKHKGGQYTAIWPAAKLSDAPYFAPRNYSLSCGPNDDEYRISVRHQKAGTAGVPNGVYSSYINEKVNAGDEFDMSPPSGNFTVDLDAMQKRTTLFLSAGSGLTPLTSMALEASAHFRDAADKEITAGKAGILSKIGIHNPETQSKGMYWLHASASDATCPHRMLHEVAASGHLYHSVKHTTLVDAPFVDGASRSFNKAYTPSRHATAGNRSYLNGQPLDAGRIAQLMASNDLSLATDVDVYLTGPLGFMKQMAQGLKRHGLPDDRLKYETFGPTAPLHD